ncbi:MAG: ParA family protein, partial [Cystobacter sp.]
MKTIAMWIEKGGCGKTWLAFNVAVGLTMRGHRVLLVDMDAQQNATAWALGGEDRADLVARGTYEAIIQGEINESHVLRPEKWPGLTLMPATAALNELAGAMQHVQGGVLHLQVALAGVAEHFDYCIIDCAPSLDARASMALHAADGVVTPVPGGNRFSLRGLK